MVFCNRLPEGTTELPEGVTILILIDGFLQYQTFIIILIIKIMVTILILIDGFLQ